MLGTGTRECTVQRQVIGSRASARNDTAAGAADRIHYNRSVSELFIRPGSVDKE